MSDIRNLQICKRNNVKHKMYVIQEFCLILQLLRKQYAESFSIQMKRIFKDQRMIMPKIMMWRMRALAKFKFML